MALEHGDATEPIIAAAIEVHRHLGPGLLESIYSRVLGEELLERGHAVRREVKVPIVYKGRTLDDSLRLDLLVDERVVVEVKSVETVLTVHESQLLSYLRLARLPLGLLINFHVPVLHKGIRRVILS